MKGRKVIHYNDVEFEPYDLDGPLQPDMSCLTLSYKRDTREGSYLIRMQPGAETIAHTHQRREEYIILEGSLIEDDGRVLRPGDYIIMDPGTHHNSRTEEGCLLLGIDY